MSDHMAVRTGFFPVVAADEVTMSQTGSSAVFSGGSVSLAQAGTNLLVAGGDAEIVQGGVLTLAALGDVTIEQGGAMLVGAGSVEVTDGFVGVALGGRVSLHDSRVLIGPAQAAAIGAGVGLVVLLGRLLGRRT
jgi:hypothetical protein